MKLLLSLVMLLTFNAHAALELDFDIFIRSGAEETLATDLKEVMESSKADLIRHVHIFRQDRDTSFLRVSMHSFKHLREVHGVLKGGKLKILNAFEALVVRSFASVQAPDFISHVEVNDRAIITFGYFGMRRAYELRENYLNFHRLSLDPKANVKKFKEIAAGAPSDIATEQVVQAKSIHDSLLGVLKEGHAMKPIGVTCGQLYCSCNGLVNCAVTRRACLELHDKDASYFKCLDSTKDGENRRNKCARGTCQIIKVRS